VLRGGRSVAEAKVFALAAAWWAPPGGSGVGRPPPWVPPAKAADRNGLPVLAPPRARLIRPPAAKSSCAVAGRA
jgi:hypothetical protein